MSFLFIYVHSASGRITLSEGSKTISVTNIESLTLFYFSREEIPFMAKDVQKWENNYGLDCTVHHPEAPT